jgi:diguanylate cyclase (GGDEF)-like protein
MQLLLQNLVEMTAHLRLEVSVLSTLFKISGVVQVRAIEIAGDTGQWWMRPSTWQHEGALITTDQEFLADINRAPVRDAAPPLYTALMTRAPWTCAVNSEGLHVMWLPAWTQDRVQACIEITQKTAFAPNRIDVIQGIFGVYQNYQSLLDYSERDALTGLFNRKTFDEQFARCASPLSSPRMADSSPTRDMAEGIHAENTQQWLAVVDIDHFKRVNDQFGHLYGDEVLILVANILRSSFDAKDRIFRFGGEEFVVLLRSTTLEHAEKAFERFRVAIEHYTFPQVGCVTVSVGFTSTSRGVPIEILGKADQALYYAKDHGRNQVCYYDKLVEQGKLQVRVSNDEIELF